MIAGEKISRKFDLMPAAAKFFCVSANTGGSSTKRRTKNTSSAGVMPTQNSARHAVAAEAEPHQRTKEKQLGVVLRKATQEGEHREPRDGDLQRAYAAKAIRQRAREPSAERRGEQRRSADQAGLGIGNRERRDDRGNRKREDLHVHRVEHPAAGAGPERVALARLH